MSEAAEGAGAFGGFVGPRTLVGFVRTAVPWLLERPAPEGPDPQPARLAPLAAHPLGWWRVLAHAERLVAQDQPTPAATTDYFALCLAAHWATAASYVPTDVDAKIRDALWLDQRDEGELATMAALARGLRAWDVSGVSARAVDSARAGGPGVVGGHDGERLSVLSGALAAHRGRGLSAAADELEAEIDAELARQAAAWFALRAAASRARPGDTAAGVGWLRLASLLAHNAGDVNQGLAGRAGRKGGEAARARFGDLLQREPARYGGAFAQAGAVYRTLLAAEGHRNYPLREVRALRTDPALLLPLGPCLDEWGARLARWPGLREADHVALVEALVAGCRRVPGQAGYYRALAGLDGALPGGLLAGPLAESCGAATRRGLREPDLRRLVAVPRVSFESGLVSRARRLLGE